MAAWLVRRSSIALGVVIVIAIGRAYAVERQNEEIRRAVDYAAKRLQIHALSHQLLDPDPHVAAQAARDLTELLGLDRAGA